MPTSRYRYAGGSPPSPAVLLNLTNPTTGERAENISALLDTGADQTVLPVGTVDALGLVKLDQEVIRGFDGQPQVLGIYAVVLQIRELAAIPLRVIASPRIVHAIVGRDVLNRYVVTLDGPNGILEITGD